MEFRGELGQYGVQGHDRGHRLGAGSYMVRDREKRRLKPRRPEGSELRGWGQGNHLKKACCRGKRDLPLDLMTWRSVGDKCS